MKYIISHRRSGAHYLIKLLDINYGIKLKELTLRHKTLYEKPESELIYLVRDPRDVMIACYFFYLEIFKPIIKSDVSLQGFLRGELNISAEEIRAYEKSLKLYDFSEYVLYDNDNHGAIHPKSILVQYWKDEMFKDPIKFWVDFTTELFGKGMLIKYENIFNDLKEHFGEKELVDYEELCAPYSRNKFIGEWKDHKRYLKSVPITEDDNQLFIDKAGNIMNLLGYLP